MMNIDAILSQASPGDVIAFSGNGLDSKIIQWFTRSPYSHIIIVLDTDCSNHQYQDVLIAESTTYTVVPDFKGQQCIQGVQVHWLSEWLKIYRAYGKAWWFPLKQKISEDRERKMQSWLWNLYDQQVPFSCPKSVHAWLLRSKYLSTIEKKSAFKFFGGFFCSELVTKALQVASVANPQLNPAAHTPKDVMQFTCFQKPKLIQF